MGGQKTQGISSKTMGGSMDGGMGRKDQRSGLKNLYNRRQEAKPGKGRRADQLVRLYVGGPSPGTGTWVAWDAIQTMAGVAKMIEVILDQPCSEKMFAWI